MSVPAALIVTEVAATMPVQLSQGWVAYSDGSVFSCHTPTEAEKLASSCVQATGLPVNAGTIELMSAEGRQLWLTYSSGKVYRCRRVSVKLPLSVRCKPLEGLPRAKRR